VCVCVCAQVYQSTRARSCTRQHAHTHAHAAQACSHTNMWHALHGVSDVCVEGTPETQVTGPWISTFAPTTPTRPTNTTRPTPTRPSNCRRRPPNCRRRPSNTTMPTKPQNPSKIYYLFASSQGEDLVEEKRGDEHRAKFLRRFRAISHAHISESLREGALRRD